MEKGFFHVNRGYWQTTDEPSEEVLATYPEGTIEVPIKPGPFHEWNGSEWVEYVMPIEKSQIDQERNLRIENNFTFNSTPFDFDIKSKTNISGAAQLAFMSVVSGAQAGDLRWHGGDYDFVWLSKDNTPVAMDAQTVINFGKAAANHESMHIFAARALKNMETIPQDYIDDKYWP